MTTARACLALLLLAPAPLGAASPADPAVDGGAGDERVAARAGEDVLTMGELRELLLLRHAHSEDGRDMLRHVVQRELIDAIGERRGVVVTAKQVDALWDELDRRARKAGTGGIRAELERSNVDAEEFRRLLRTSIVQEVLTRRALGLAPDAEVTADQRDVWIDQEIRERGLEVLPRPWRKGVVARCGEVEVTARELGELLAEQLPDDEVREAAWHALLLRGVERRMPDLSEEAVERALDREIERRRAEAEANPMSQGVSFKAMLAAQGQSPATLRQDPAVRIAALAALWVDRKYGEEGLRRAYEEERASFDARFGVALDVSVLFLRGAKLENPWNPRTIEEAEEELRRLLPRATSAEAFAELARERSEDAATRAGGGSLGWITRGDSSAPAEVREAAFDLLDAGRRLPAGGRVAGPVRLPNGAALLWVGGVREAPGWDEMSGLVHRELRGRFLRDVLPQERVKTFRDR